MVDTVYFLFLDELYTSNLNEFRKINRDAIFDRETHWHFGLAGTILPASSLYELYSKSRRIKNKFYPQRDNLIFHYTDTLNKKDNFSDLAINQKKYIAYTSSLNNLVINTDFKYVSCYIDKHELIKNYGTFNNKNEIVNIKKIGSNLFPKSSFLNYNLYLLCLKHLIVNFFKFITNKKCPARGIIVAEARGSKEDTELRKAFQKIYYEGISSIHPTELRSIILDLFIVPKEQNYIGTQLTDMVIYPTYDAIVPCHNQRNDHFIKFNTVLKNKLLKDGNLIIP